MAHFSYAASNGTNYWSVDVPHNFSPPPPDTEITIGVVTMEANAVITRGDIVFAFADGRLVMTCRIEAMASALALQLTLMPNLSDPAIQRFRVTAVRTRVIPCDVVALYQAGETPLLKQVAGEIGPEAIGACFIGAATDFHRDTGRALYESIETTPADCAPEAKDVPIPEMEDCVRDAFTIGRRSPRFWAMDVPHNFRSPEIGKSVTAFVSSMRPDVHIAIGDIIYAFSRARLVMVTKVTELPLHPQLEMSLEVSSDPSCFRSYVTVATAEVIDVDVIAPYRDGNEQLRDLLASAVRTQFNSPAVLIGDAQPFNELLGEALFDAVTGQEFWGDADPC